MKNRRTARSTNAVKEIMTMAATTVFDRPAEGTENLLNQSFDILSGRC